MLTKIEKEMEVTVTEKKYFLMRKALNHGKSTMPEEPEVIQ